MGLFIETSLATLPFHIIYVIIINLLYIAYIISTSNTKINNHIKKSDIMTKYRKASSDKPVPKLVITINKKIAPKSTADVSLENPTLVDSDKNTVLPFLNHRAILPDGNSYSRRLARSGYVPQHKHFSFLTAAIEKRNAIIAEEIISSTIIQNAINYIQKHVDKAFPSLSLQIQPYGGAVNGISMSGGDIDSTLIVDNCNRVEKESTEYFWAFLKECAKDRLDKNPAEEVGFLDDAFKKRFPSFGFDASSYYKGVIPSKDIMDEYSLFCSSRYLSDTACVKNASQPISVMDLFPDAKEPSEDMIYFILRRIHWQNVIILSRLAVAFNDFEILSFVFRSRVPVLKVRLKYSKKLGRVIPAEETTAKIEQGMLQSYYSDIPTSRFVRFIVPEGEEKPNTQIDNDMILLNVDICLNNKLAMRNTLLLAEYLRANPIVRPLIRYIKNWAAARNLCTTLQGGLSSYGFVLLVIFYLQVLQNPIVPILQPDWGHGPIIRGYDTGFLSLENAWYRRALMTGESQQKTTSHKPAISELLCGFFRFYGYQFDINKFVVSIRLGRALSKQEKGWDDISNTYRSQHPGDHLDNYKASEHIKAADVLRVFKHPPEVPDADVSRHIYKRDNQLFYMCIEDPFETHLNVGRYLDYNATKLLGQEFRRGYALLRKTEKPIDHLFLPSYIDPPGRNCMHVHDLLEMESASKSQPTSVKIEVTKNRAFEFVDIAPVPCNIEDE